MGITLFEQLDVWQKGHDLVLKVDKQSALFPSEERYGLIPQMRRAAVSVPANIAEGFSRRGQQEKFHFYNTAKSSLEELRCYFILSRDLEFRIEFNDIMAHADQTARMLSGLMRAVQNRTT
ncbi:MAG: four helix bundle protein [Chlorobi bacterium]|nr:four helix bundle protein [Chlorobiota bacterium]